MVAAAPQRTWWLAFALVCCVTALLSAISYAGQMPGIVPETNLDKVVHFVVGGALATTLDGALKRRSIGFLPIAVPAVLVPAGIEEWLQRYSDTRTSSLGDFAADVAGVVVCTWLARRWR